MKSLSRPRTALSLIAASSVAAVLVAPAGSAVAGTASGVSQSAPFPTAAAAPCEIHFTSDGIGWVEEIAANKIGRYDPATGAISEVSIPTPASVPGGEAIGPDGGVWFTEVASNKIARLDPTTERIDEFPIPIPGALGAVPTPVGAAASDAIEAGPDNAMWFTEIGNNAIGRIDLATHQITSYPIPTPLAGPLIIHRGPGNTLIFPESAADKIGQFDVTTHKFTEYQVPTPNAVPQGVTTGSDGAIWFTETAGEKIGRIDPITHKVTEWSIAVPSNQWLPRPGPIVQGSDGNFYVAEGNLDGGQNIGQFNPATRMYQDIAIPSPLASGCDLNVHGNNIYFGELVANRIGWITTTPGTAGGTPSAADLAASDLAAGDGAGAAGQIRAGGLANDPTVLANILYQGGLYAVESGSGDAYARAVAYALPHGGVTLATANVTFGIAGFQAGSGMLSPAELSAGSQAIALTYVAYALGAL